MGSWWILLGSGLLGFLVFLLFSKRKHAPLGSVRSVYFVHLDLGVGGAERLIVDAACAIQSKGNKVTILTTNHPADHCFPETKEILKVEQHGNFLPAHIFGKGQAFCSLLRMNYVSLKLLLFSNPHIIFCDGVSGCIPLLKLSRAKIIFYCHFPDQLLTRKKSWIRQIYRWPLDLFEEITTGMADQILVNSQFTSNIFSKTFRSIRKKPTIVYPCVNVKQFDTWLQFPSTFRIPSDSRFFLSINRFDPNKNIDLAISSFSLFRKTGAVRLLHYQLVIAGGYDQAVSMNVKYLSQLQKLVQRENLTFEVLSEKTREKWSSADVLFMPDISERHKVELLRSCVGLMYTPSNEHFGIVPVEAMLARCPVIGIRSGGLLETITTDMTVGILCNSEAKEFADALKKLVESELSAKQMGEMGRQRAIDHFSFEKLASNLESILIQLQNK